MEELNRLPPSMLIRARWARQQILEHQELVEVDEDELLAWIFNKEDNVWYSIDGNYSSQSPKVKIEKRKERIKNQLEWEEKTENLSLERDAEQKYYSRVRQRILERDNFTCQKCGQKMDKLHIHHIIKQKEGRIDADDNLISVCHSCHRKLDGKEYGLYKSI